MLEVTKNTPRKIKITTVAPWNNKGNSYLIQFKDESIVNDNRFNGVIRIKEPLTYAENFRAIRIKSSSEILDYIMYAFDQDIHLWVTYDKSEYIDFCVTNLKILESDSKNLLYYMEEYPEEFV